MLMQRQTARAASARAHQVRIERARKQGELPFPRATPHSINLSARAPSPGALRPRARAPIDKTHTKAHLSRMRGRRAALDAPTRRIPWALLDDHKVDPSSDPSLLFLLRVPPSIPLSLTQTNRPRAAPPSCAAPRRPTWPPSRTSTWR
jgi:hypothetical protein